MDTKVAIKTAQADKLLRVLAFTLVISVMNATMFNVALPQISVEFGLTSSQVSWIVTAYIVVFAIGSVTYAKLTDKYLLKNLLTVGLIFFALGSIIGFFANEFMMIVLARVLQALGASVVTAASMIIPVRYFSENKRGRALGMTSAGIAFGTAAGPIISGIITSAASWRFLFLPSLLAVFALPFFRKYLDDIKGTAKQTDVWGGLLLGSVVAAFLLALTSGDMRLLAVGFVLMILFLIRIRLAEEPFLQPALFRNNLFSLGLALTFLSFFTIFSIPFLVPLLLSHLYASTPQQIGFAMFPAAALSAILGRQGGKIADERGNGTLFYCAAALLATGFVLLSSTTGVSLVFVILFLIFCNLGMTFMQIATANAISRTLTGEQMSVGMGIFSMLGFISGAVALAVIGRVLDSGTPTWKLNPFYKGGPGLVYSNLFLSLAILVIFSTLLFAVLSVMERKK